MTEPWQELGETEHAAMWDRFELAFDFRPSVRPQDWPGIREPAPSVTYDISWVYDDPEAAALEAELDAKVLAAFRRCAPPGGRLYALDWQHASYRLDPHAVSALPVPVLPNGDYYIYVAPDLSLGTFGHPWEQTICVFGAPLLDAIAADQPRLLGRPIRSHEAAV